MFLRSLHTVMGLVLPSMSLFVVLCFPPGSRSSSFPLKSAGQDELLPPPYLTLPVFLHHRYLPVPKHDFSLTGGKNRVPEPVPERVRQVLVPAPRRTQKSRRVRGAVRVTCTPSEMRVRVQTGSGEQRVPEKLGSCGVSRTAAQYVVFQYQLHQCGTNRQVINNTLVYSNVLHFSPGEGGSELYSVPVRCRFNRFHYSYKIGFVPQVEPVRFFKPMRTKGSVSLRACDEHWNRLSPSDAFVIGKPMYFEAETHFISEDERLFVHSCHVTTNSSSVSTPRVDVIHNYGCLTDSKSSSRSRFIRSDRRNVVRFSIDAFTLHEKLDKHLFLHCEMSICPATPTPTSKSCTYDQQEGRWEELSGLDSVCTCCDSTCLSEKATEPDRSVMSELRSVVLGHAGKSEEIRSENKDEKMTPESKNEINTQESEEGRITPTTTEKLMTLENERRITPADSGTITKENKHETIRPESEERKITVEDKHRITTPGSGTITQEEEDGTISPESEDRTIPVENEYGIITPKTKNGNFTSDVEFGTAPQTVTPQTEYGTSTSGSDYGDITVKSDHETMIPDSNKGTISPGTISSGSVYETDAPESGFGKTTPTTEPGTTAPEQEDVKPRQREQIPERRRIFEEVFGLSK